MSDQQELIERTRDFVRRTLASDSTGHDWWHVERVWRNAVLIARAEGALSPTVELAALLHDIADWKFHDGDETAGARAAEAWLASQAVDRQTIDEVCNIVRHLSFKGADVIEEPLPLAGQIVQDADRLDALGAIGIARAFAYGGHTGRLLYDPNVPPERHDSFAAYQKNTGPTINHFYEKLLLLKDRMHTVAARRLAAERHAFMEEFLQRFYAEWQGEE